MAFMKAEHSTPANNPNHPRVRCVDGTGPYGEWTGADDSAQPVTAPYRVFDILNQTHIGPAFPCRWMAETYMVLRGGPMAKGEGDQ